MAKKDGKAARAEFFPEKGPPEAPDLPPEAPPEGVKDFANGVLGKKPVWWVWTLGIVNPERKRAKYFLGMIEGSETQAVLIAKRRWPKFIGTMELEEAKCKAKSYEDAGVAVFRK